MSLNNENPDKYLLEDLKEILASPSGRRLLMRLIKESNYLKASYVTGDTHTTAFNEGLRRMGQWLALKINEAKPGELFRLLAEEGEKDGRRR